MDFTSTSQEDQLFVSAASTSQVDEDDEGQVDEDDEGRVDEDDEGRDTDQDASRGQTSSSLSEQPHLARVYDISRRVEDLVERINARRTDDQKVMDSFQEKLIEQVTEMCQQMKEHMYTVYEESSHDMQAKLQELSRVVESCSKLSDELLGASEALASLRAHLPQAPPL